MPVLASVLRAILLLGLAMATVACYNFAAPSYHPGDARQVLIDLTGRGVDVASSVTGESACDDPGLVANALHLRASVPSDPTVRDVYIYAFRSKSWDASTAPVDACQAAYVAAHPGVTITRLDIPTYRAFGADWSPELTRSLTDALGQAAQEGG